MLYADFLREKYTNTIQTGEVEGVPPLTLPRSKGKPLKDYRIYGNSYQRLPQEYQEVEYIESTGSQYIDTGLKGNQDTRVFIDFQNNSGNGMIFGARTSATSNAFAIWTSSAVLSSSLRVGFDGTSGYSGEAPNTDRITIESDKTQVKRDGIKVYDVPSIWNNFETPKNLLIFAYDNDGVVTRANAKIYSCRLWQSGILVRDMIPCYRKSDNEIGMYDLVENKFYTNKGTGTFLKGEDIVPTPDNPIEIESVGERTKNLLDINELYYISSNGARGVKKNNSLVLTTITPASWQNASYRIPLPEEINSGDTITFSFKTIAEYKSDLNFPQLYIRFIDADLNYLTNYVSFKEKYSTTIPLNTAYIYVMPQMISNWQRGDTVVGDTCEFFIKLEKGSTATQYEPYGYKIPVTATNGTDTFTANIYLDEPLRRIGTYADYIDFRNKKVVRNNCFIDMSKLSWSYNTSYLSSGLFTVTPTNKSSGQTNVISEIYQTGPQFQSFSQMRNKAIAGYTSGANRNVAVRDDDYNASTLNDFQNSLKGKYMCYQLETPTEESIELPPVQTAKGTCILRVGTSIQPSKMYAKYIK